MRHILFIDPLLKLAIKKDSSLMLALSLKSKGYETYLLFESDFHWYNHLPLKFNLYKFEGKIDPKSCYITKFELGECLPTLLKPKDTIHMRIDPPFDSRYLCYLWMLKALKDKKIRVVNSPEGILLHNEKLHAYQHRYAIPTYVGSSYPFFQDFLQDLSKQDYQHLIIKPLNLYQGIGIEKANIGSPAIEAIFQRKIKEYKGPIVAQPFISEIKNGEVRALYYKGRELGSILKIPPAGEFLANIAQGASFKKHQLTPKQKSMCREISQKLFKYGIDLIAFDILADYISEVNITCPGLLVEASHAHKTNLALSIESGTSTPLPCSAQ